MLALLARWVGLSVGAVLDFAGQRHRERAIAALTDTPLVSVIVPAWNEATVIGATLRSIAASRWPALEILLVDDGSTDGTAEAGAAIAGVRVLRQPRNAGKPAALDAGLQACRGELVVTVDADTQVDPDLVGWLARTQLATGAAAVAANVKVGNRQGLLGRWQSLEYVTGLNLDRRTQSLLGVITTVPGAASLWRKGAVLAAGGFPGDTLAEDTDLSLALLRRGERIVYQDRAVAYTEAPSTWAGLYRQRTRWIYGNLQCAWKHRGALAGPPRVALLALPNFWYANALAFALLPLALTGATAVDAEAWPLVARVAGGLALIDLAGVALAYALDREDPRDLVHALPQRVAWPFFLWAVFARVAWRFARKAPVGWGKLARTGTVAKR